MQDHFERIYRDHADIYDQLVEREDHERNLLRVLKMLCAPAGRDIVEWGAGTGRITRMLAPLARQLHAFDASPAMLEIANKRLDPAHAGLVHFAVAPHHQIPLPNQVADIAVEGWSFGHLAEGLPADEGAAAAQQALDEMARIVRPGGSLLLIETLGTGRTTPEPPAPYLEQLYRYFEQQGFERHACRTDYAFESRDEASRLIEFFFGDSMLPHLDAQTQTLPECTGIWHRVRS